MMRRIVLSVLVLVLLQLASFVLPPHLIAASASPAEMCEATTWIRAKMDGVVERSVPAAFIEVVANNDPVFASARQGRPLKIGAKTLAHGLYCHANSSIIVHLPSPAKEFEAVVGIDSNDNTAGGRGSVRFSLVVAGKEIWKSAILREGMEPISVRENLAGATTFELRIDDGGDGISHDQADWGEVRVVLENGQTLALGELPVVHKNEPQFSTEPFFSFDYGGKSSREFLSQWKCTRKKEVLDAKRTLYTITYADDVTGLEARIEAVAYSDYPTVEWTLHFANRGTNETPIISNIQTIDTEFFRSGVKEFEINFHRGDECTAESFEPFTETLRASTHKHIANTGGRPTQTAFPYFNLQCGDAGGIIFVVSWAGQWNADFVRDAASGITLRAGQEQTNFKLLPGESVRQPMVVLQFWNGNVAHSQNVWRSWMIDHNIPRDRDGQLPPLPLHVACSSHWFNEMILADTASQILFIDQYLRRGMKLDYWWMDAGWYPVPQTNNWPETGTWEVDEARFPGGFAPISDHAHKQDVDIIVWFEPERVAAGTWLTTEHPDWVHGGAGGGLLHLGKPEVLAWLIDHVDKLITDNKIDLYRQDFNIDPLSYWRQNDAPDRQGITEIRHVEAYFAYWDALRERHPGMLIDSCASGGRRNDLETLRRAVPLLRSDYIMEPVGNQAHSYVMPMWFPFFGTGTSHTSTYDIRSTLCPSFNSCWDVRNDSVDFARIVRIVDEWREFGKFYFGDYYPLTSYSLDTEKWIGWQYHDASQNAGFVQVFRRDKSPFESARFPLQAVDDDAVYNVRNVSDDDHSITIRGSELKTTGLPIVITERPGSAVYVYSVAR
ncbi:MAG: NPCBM/NEW2 domain-containing protein [Thermoguttaceae bacterium]